MSIDQFFYKLFEADLRMNKTLVYSTYYGAWFVIKKREEYTHIMQKILWRSTISFLPFAVCITLLSGLIYFSSQQVIRLSANEMPSLSVDTALARISIGQQLNTILPNVPIELSKPFGFFFSAYNEQKVLTIAQTTVHGASVTIPDGVFDYAKLHGKDRVTWQPETGIRLATVVVYEPKTKTYLVAGRDLTDYEHRIETLGIQILLGWALTMGGTFVAVCFKHIMHTNKR